MYFWRPDIFGVFWGVKRGPRGCQKHYKIPDLSKLDAIKHEFFVFPILLKGFKPENGDELQQLERSEHGEFG